ASGVIENTANGLALKEVYLIGATDVRIRDATTTAVVVDIGSVPGIISWERWTNGNFTRESGPAIDIPLNAGLSFVYGMPASNVANYGTSVQYSLVGATIPTISDGSVPISNAVLNTNAFVGSGGIGSTSKLGIDFTTMKAGFNMYVQIGAGWGLSFYQFATAGGAADPSNGGFAIVNNMFSTNGPLSTNGLPVTLGGTGDGGVSSCTAANLCKAGVTGFLAGDGGNNNGPINNGTPSPYVGLNYYFGNTLNNPSSTLVNGAAAFGRDMPITEAAAIAFAYSDGIPANDFNQAVVGKANSQLAGDTTPSGLSLQQIWIEQNDSSGMSPNFFRGAQFSSTPAIVVEQGTLSGGLSSGITGAASVGGILGWERWTGSIGQPGTITTCTAQPCDAPNSKTFTLSANQGLHIVHGVPATDLPTSGLVTYNLAGATSPTVANGSVSPGTLLTTSTMSVNFGANPGVSADLKVAINSENYNVKTPIATPMPLNNVRFDSGGLNLPVTYSGLNPATLCTGSSCKGSIGGFLAGPGAIGLGIFYQIGTGPTSPTLISGAAGFKKTP
ncbi:MAG: hypothetical protein Q7S17_02840, partial [Xanthobacteraceae bacterium]|nr:hypothetical protein [Xanthobacteraceae bacterium]